MPSGFCWGVAIGVTGRAEEEAYGGVSRPAGHCRLVLPHGPALGGGTGPVAYPFTGLVAAPLAPTALPATPCNDFCPLLSSPAGVSPVSCQNPDKVGKLVFVFVFVNKFIDFIDFMFGCVGS